MDLIKHIELSIAPFQYPSQAIEPTAIPGFTVSHKLSGGTPLCSPFGRRMHKRFFFSDAFVDQSILSPRPGRGPPPPRPNSNPLFQPLPQPVPLHLIQPILPTLPNGNGRVNTIHPPGPLPQGPQPILAGLPPGPQATRPPPGPHLGYGHLHPFELPPWMPPPPCPEGTFKKYFCKRSVTNLSAFLLIISPPDLDLGMQNQESLLIWHPGR